MSQIDLLRVLKCTQFSSWELQTNLLKIKEIIALVLYSISVKRIYTHLGLGGPLVFIVKLIKTREGILVFGKQSFHHTQDFDLLFHLLKVDDDLNFNQSCFQTCNNVTLTSVVFSLL